MGYPGTWWWWQLFPTLRFEECPYWIRGGPLNPWCVAAAPDMQDQGVSPLEVGGFPHPWMWWQLPLIPRFEEFPPCRGGPLDRGCCGSSPQPPGLIGVPPGVLGVPRTQGVVVAPTITQVRGVAP